MSQDVEQLKAEITKRDEQISVLLSQKSESALGNFKRRRDALSKAGVSADTLARRVDPILNKKDDKGVAVLLSQTDESILDAVLSTLEENISTRSIEHGDADLDEALLSQNYVPDGNEPMDDDDKAWAYIKKVCG